MCRGVGKYAARFQLRLINEISQMMPRAMSDRAQDGLGRYDGPCLGGDDGCSGFDLAALRWLASLLTVMMMVMVVVRLLRWRARRCAALDVFKCSNSRGW